MLGAVEVRVLQLETTTIACAIAACGGVNDSGHPDAVVIGRLVKLLCLRLINHAYGIAVQVATIGSHVSVPENPEWRRIPDRGRRIDREWKVLTQG